MTGSAAMSALSIGDVVEFLAALESVDQREIITLDSGKRAVVVLVGVTTIRSMDGGALDAHTHNDAEEASACFAANVDAARTFRTDDEPLAALLAALNGGQRVESRTV